MTDDGTPIELSWDWGWGNEPVVVKYSVEPIGIDAGTESDPLNEYAGARLIHRLRKLEPRENFVWFDHFWKELLFFSNQSQASRKISDSRSSDSQFFVGFDLHQEDILIKAYFLPALKSAMVRTLKLDLISQAITRIPNYQRSDFCSFAVLHEYMQTAPKRLLLDVELLSIDCMAPIQSRLKVYVRSRSTGFEPVREVITLGGRLSSNQMEHGLKQFQV